MSSFTVSGCDTWGVPGCSQWRCRKTERFGLSWGQGYQQVQYSFSVSTLLTVPIDNWVITEIKQGCRNTLAWLHAHDDDEQKNFWDSQDQNLLTCIRSIIILPSTMIESSELIKPFDHLRGYHYQSGVICSVIAILFWPRLQNQGKVWNGKKFG